MTLEEKQAVERVRQCVEDVMLDLQNLFVDEVKLTFITRLPGNDDADMVITRDNLNEVRKVIDRMLQKESIDQNKETKAE